MESNVVALRGPKKVFKGNIAKALNDRFCLFDYDLQEGLKEEYQFLKVHSPLSDRYKELKRLILAFGLNNPKAPLYIPL